MFWREQAERLDGGAGWWEYFLQWDSYLRLVVSYLMEATEDWANDYAYIKAEKLSPILENRLAQVAN